MVKEIDMILRTAKRNKKKYPGEYPSEFFFEGGILRAASGATYNKRVSDKGWAKQYYEKAKKKGMKDISYFEV
jgi:hypothetical protein